MDPVVINYWVWLPVKIIAGAALIILALKALRVGEDIPSWRVASAIFMFAVAVAIMFPVGK